MSIKVIRYRLPSYWACPLINDDYTGLTDEECEEIQRFFGIEEKPKYDFKPFDKVLVRDEDDKEWHISLFAREIVDDSDGLSYKHECSNGTLWDCPHSF